MNDVNANRLVEYLGSIMESGDLTNDGHCRQVRRCSELITDKLMQFYPEFGLTEEDRTRIRLAAASHDVGKIAVPDWILQKPGRLTFEEFEIMKNHTRKGYKMFQQLLLHVPKDDVESRRLFECCANVCLSHHERYDGGGYPLGISGNDIPIEAQIVGLADAYDVLVSERIYKSAYTGEEAFEMIMEGECGVFHPKLIQIFQMSRMELEEIYE